MLLDIPHEYEVLLAFFSREAAYVKAACSNLSSDDNMEEQLFNPAGPGSTEEILCRMSITEANALIEAAMQEALAFASDDRYFTVKSGSSARPKYIFEMNRKELEEALRIVGVDVNGISFNEQAKQIKEICEGHKHRQRLRPVPKWTKASGTIEDQQSIVPGAMDVSFSTYDLNISNVHEYLLATKAFLDELHKTASARVC